MLVGSKEYNLVPQKIVRANMLKTIPQSYISNFISKVYDNNYYIQFYAGERLNDCYNIAKTFSDYPDTFLNNRRKEIQFNRQSFTLSVDKWVTVDSVPNGSITLDFSIQYYIHTSNKIPHTIFFRISKSYSDYQKKLEFFIDLLIKKKTIGWHKDTHTEYSTIELPDSSPERSDPNCSTLSVILPVSFVIGTALLLLIFNTVEYNETPAMYIGKRVAMYISNGGSHQAVEYTIGKINNARLQSLDSDQPIVKN